MNKFDDVQRSTGVAGIVEGAVVGSVAGWVTGGVAGGSGAGAGAGAAAPVGSAVITLTNNIAIPKIDLPMMPQNRPLAAPMPNCIDSPCVRPFIFSLRNAPSPAPATAPRIVPTIGKIGEPRIPPTIPPMIAPAIPRFDPPAAFEPAAPAMNSTSSAISARTVTITSDHQPTWAFQSVTHPYAACAATISHRPGRPRMLTNRPTNSRTTRAR